MHRDLREPKEGTRQAPADGLPVEVSPVDLEQPGDEGRALALLNTAMAALTDVKSVPDVVAAIGVANAARLIAQRVCRSRELQNQCAEIRLNAQRKGGQMLSAIPRAKGGGDHRYPKGTGGPTLEELGITKKDSSIWQKLASIPDDVFNEHLAQAIAGGAELTTANVLRLASSRRDGDAPRTRTRQPKGRIIKVDPAPSEGDAPNVDAEGTREPAAPESCDEAERSSAESKRRRRAGADRGNPPIAASTASDAIENTPCGLSTDPMDPDAPRARRSDGEPTVSIEERQADLLTDLRLQTRGLREVIDLLDDSGLRQALRDIEDLVAVIRLRVESIDETSQIENDQDEYQPADEEPSGLYHPTDDSGTVYEEVEE